MVRQRKQATQNDKKGDPGRVSKKSGISKPIAPSPQQDVNAMTWVTQNRWVVLAIASGACAAFNGVFAKLTTTELTSTISKSITSFFGLDSIEGGFEYVLRAAFFACNLIFNGIMWTLFTKALASGNSTTQVSIINTGANFVLTAVMGFMIFAEDLPPLWWLGAAMLVAGNVIVGRKDETAGEAGDEAAYAPVPQQTGVIGDDLEDGNGANKRDERYEDEDIIDLGDLTASGDAQGRR